MALAVEPELAATIDAAQNLAPVLGQPSIGKEDRTGAAETRWLHAYGAGQLGAQASVGRADRLAGDMRARLQLLHRHVVGKSAQQT